jgi:hypothetical protein
VSGCVLCICAFEMCFDEQSCSHSASMSARTYMRLCCRLLLASSICRPLCRVHRLSRLARPPASWCRWRLSWGSLPSLAAAGNPARGGRLKR